jgi:hypothetical protein
VSGTPTAAARYRVAAVRAGEGYFFFPFFLSFFLSFLLFLAMCLTRFPTQAGQQTVDHLTSTYH